MLKKPLLYLWIFLLCKYVAVLCVHFQLFSECPNYSSMDQLEKVAKDLVASSKRQNTRRTYNSAQRYYIDFCKQYKLTILASDQNTLLLYVAHMYHCNYKINSIKVYLSAVRAMNIEEGYSNPLEDAIKVDLALRAITINSKAPCQKLPITYQLLCRVSQYINKSYESKLLWAAMTIGHFGLLRASEFVIASHISLKKLHSLMSIFYVCINLSRCTVIPNCKQVSLYVIVRAHKLELASRAFIQRK